MVRLLRQSLGRILCACDVLNSSLGREVTPRPPARESLAQLRLLLATDGLSQWASRMKATTGRDPRCVRDLSREDNPLPTLLDVRVGYRHRGQQRLRTVLRSCEM